MNNREPVYTEKAECRDCYKCVRNCAVKAIGVVNDSATVLPERCIACGRCVEVCPAGAKRVRDDLSRAKELLGSRKRVYLSLAPSFVSEFRGGDAAHLIHAARGLGFAGVSETALGAEQVSAEVARRLREASHGVFVSSACPAVVELLTKYLPTLGAKVTELASPVLAHCRLLRATFGDDIGIVFVGPCIAKKKEADAHPELLDVAITFEDLRAWLEERQIPLLGSRTGAADVFVPYRATDGAIYPVDGGMVDSIKAAGQTGQATFASLSGLETIQRALEGLDTRRLERPLFLELLACEGGCVNGPKGSSHTGTILKRQAVRDYATLPAAPLGRLPCVDTGLPLLAQAVLVEEYPEQRLREALREVGKYSSLDELNCGGCGYDNCRTFARALLDGQAERTMCVSYMRKLAQTKANILMKTMPSGVVVVDEQLQIVECNANFARLLGEEALAVYEAKPGLEGALLERLLPFHAIFARVLASGDALVEKDVRTARGVFQLSVFTIEPQRLVGGIMRDVTEPVVQKERVIQKTREVMIKNLNTVQQIARLLGENAADSETILSSIIESFEAPPPLPPGNPRQTETDAHG